MVNRSYLCHVSGGAAPIAWSRIPQASKNEAKRFHKRDASPAEQTLPPTVGALAEMLDESTFFGYMTEELCTLLMDISEFGLEAKASVFGGTTKLCTRTPGPHIYMKYTAMKQLRSPQPLLNLQGTKNLASLLIFSRNLDFLALNLKDSPLAQAQKQK